MSKKVSLVSIYLLACCWKCVTGSNCTVELQDELIRDQRELDQLLIDMSYNNSTPLCLRILFAGDTFTLDIVELMRVHFTSLTMIGSGGQVNINCMGGQFNLEVLRNNLQPLSNVSLVLVDGLVFSKCPVPLLIEKASAVVIQNCVFRYVQHTVWTCIQ